ncbi:MULTISPECIES: alkaline phosphatase family protein [unclassified Gordonia (in: high G+C Gram-positive bacteria)]
MDRAPSAQPATADVVMEELPPADWGAHPRTLADVLPWIGTTLLDPGAATEGMPDLAASTVVLLMVDGLGDRLLQRHADDAPTLARLRAAGLRAGFPSTTATSITSLTTGAPCGVHGIIGYAFRPDDDSRTRGTPRLLNALRWTMDSSDGPSALVTYPPNLVAPLAGALAGLADAGVEISYVMPGEFRGTGLTQVAFRATGRYWPANSSDSVLDGVVNTLVRRSKRPRFVYAYLSDLDAAGHRYGPGSPEWLGALRTVDRLVADIASSLPADASLAVTGDHGMLAAGRRIDLDVEDALTAGVAMIAGEPRVRHLYTEDGARDDVLAAWAQVVGDDDARTATREQVLDEGWFGHAVPPRIASRIGDIVAVGQGTTVLVRSEAEPSEAKMIGHHGAWTADEQLVPLLVASG